MIFKEEDILTLTTENGNTLTQSLIKIHTPTEVFFRSVTRLEDTYDHYRFEVGQLNKEGEAIDIKNFKTLEVVSNKQKVFFDAVEYFESLISKRQPQPESDEPYVGVLVYVKGAICYAKVSNSTVDINEDDLPKVFTPPQSKKYGRLNMFAVQDSKYDIIKGKFALKYDESLTIDLLNQNNNMKYADITYVYKMIPYDTSEDGDGDGGTPEDVNDNSLKLDEIEGETPEQMRGEEGQGEEGQGEEGQSEKGQGEEGQGEEGQGEDGKGENGQGEDGQGEDGQGEEGQGEEGQGEEGQGEEGQGEEGQGEEGQGEEGQGEDGESAGTEKQLRQREILNNYVPSTYLRNKSRTKDYFESINLSELKKNWFPKLEIPENTSKEDFIIQINKTIEKYTI